MMVACFGSVAIVVLLGERDLGRRGEGLPVRFEGVDVRGAFVDDDAVAQMSTSRRAAA